jgi:SAM-dependent methyltransferase
MISMIRRIEEVLQSIGLDIVKLLKNLSDLPHYFRKYKTLRAQKGEDTLFPFGKWYPRLREWKEQGGVASGHYFHQDLFVAQQICKHSPVRHIDIGSLVDGFVAHVAAFREIEVWDIRAIDSKVQNIKFYQADLMQLPEALIASTDSVSSLHAIEHFGLGRYGDPIDYFGYKKAIENIHAILKEKGRFYFSVPIGPQRIEYNAHRVFSLKYLFDYLATYFEIETLSIVDDNGNFHKHVQISDAIIENNYGCHYGCGIFELIKR